MLRSGNPKVIEPCNMPKNGLERTKQQSSTKSNAEKYFCNHYIYKLNIEERIFNFNKPRSGCGWLLDPKERGYKKSRDVGSFRFPRTLPDEVLPIKEDGAEEPLYPILKIQRQSTFYKDS